MSNPASENLHHVVATSLEPIQQPTSVKRGLSSLHHQQIMCKHPFLSDFYSLAQYLYAGLLEGDASVISYVPQPFFLRVGRRKYTPSFYVLRENARPQIIHFESRERMNDSFRVLLQEFFIRERMVFDVISSESVFAREMEANNWLEIIHTLYTSRYIETAAAEAEVLQRFLFAQRLTLRDFVDQGNRERTFLTELALFRLLHAGHLIASLKTERLGWDTEIWHANNMA